MSTDHSDVDIGLPEIGPTGTTSSSNTLCAHRQSFSAAVPSDLSILTIQRSSTKSNQKPLRGSLHTDSPIAVTHKCGCTLCPKSSVKENEPTAPTAVHIEDVSTPLNDLRSTVAQGPTRTPYTVAENVVQPLQLTERRERHNCDARIRNMFQQSQAEIGNETDTGWWLKLATWWFIKVCPKDGGRP